MSSRRSPTLPSRLRLRVGDLVEVRSKEEILATLTADGCLDELPFMPEMLALCGQRVRVEKRADKTCDTIEQRGLRRMESTVHLAGTRCTGAAHGGCQAACNLFWKEAWLRRVDAVSTHQAGQTGQLLSAGCSEERLQACSRQEAAGGDSEVRYRCQATDLLKASRPMSSWDVRQYWRDVKSGNVTVSAMAKAIAWWLFRYSQYHLRGYRLQRWLFNTLQRVRGGMPDVPLAGTKTRTPSETLGLMPGERVQVKGIEEIRDTLNPDQRNRGLYFDREMTPFCGGTYRVHSRVTQIIEEASGRMIMLPGDCVILDGAFCTGRYHQACPRAIYPYWREIWLRRAAGPRQPDRGPA